MSDLLAEVAARLQTDYGMQPTKDGKYLRKGKCPQCHAKDSLWTYADTPWVVRCEHLNKCGWEAHAKELYADLFTNWSERARVQQEAKPEEQRNPNAAADLYLAQGRGFDLARIKGLYTQEAYFDPHADKGRGASTATVRFAVGETWWERLIDKPERFGKKKANFKTGASYAGHWWAMPTLTFAAPTPGAPEDAPKPPTELWLVEGIFDAIALAHNDVPAVALMSCNNYPAKELAAIREQILREGRMVKEPRLVFALDGDKAGRDYTRRWVKRAREDGWTVSAAQIPQPRDGKKLDWNDLHQRGKLEDDDLKEYAYQGKLLIAESALDKALLMWNHTQRGEFDLEFGRELFWFRLNQEAFEKTMSAIESGSQGKRWEPLELRNEAARQAGVLQKLANCMPRALYYQRNEVTQEAWYYFAVNSPHDIGEPVKGTFTAGQLTTASEFKKQLLHIARGALYTGSGLQLDRIMQRQLNNIKEVQTVDFIGYSKAHQVYLLGDYAVHAGQVLQANAQDYFEVGKLSIKSLQRSVGLQINADPETQDKTWPRYLWDAFGAKGYVALAFWFGSLYAEQVRATQMSFPFLEIVGEPGSGKTTLIQFLWKLFGRDYEGFDPSKSTAPGRMRTFTQVSGLPIVLIESDRETKSGHQAHVKSFDWDELKDAYNGRNVRTTGVRTSGNETYEPPFRASIVISQNNAVDASQAVMERICHLTFSKESYTAQSYEAAKRLERYEIASLSGFILACLRQEEHVLALLEAETEKAASWMLAQEGVTHTRIAKNHAQLLVIVRAMRPLMKITEAQYEAVRDLIVQMARDRQAAISADHPLIAEFWEAFDYLDRMPKREYLGHEGSDGPHLNHSRDKALIAVNLNEFVEQASLHRQQIPIVADLKKVLRSSKTRPFKWQKAVNSAISGRTVHCWVFEAGK